MAKAENMSLVIQAKTLMPYLSAFLSDERCDRCPMIHRMSILIDRPPSIIAQTLIFLCLSTLLLNPFNIAPLIVNTFGVLYPAHKTLLHLSQIDLKTEGPGQAPNNASTEMKSEVAQRYMDYWILFIGSVVIESVSQYLLGLYLGVGQMGWGIDAAGLDMLIAGYWAFKAGAMGLLLFCQADTRPLNRRGTGRAGIVAPTPIRVTSQHRTPAKNLSAQADRIKNKKSETTVGNQPQNETSRGDQPVDLSSLPLSPPDEGPESPPSSRLRPRYAPAPTVQFPTIVSSTERTELPALSPRPIFASPTDSADSPLFQLGPGIASGTHEDSEEDSESDYEFDMVRVGNLQDRISTPGSGVERDRTMYGNLTPGGLPLPGRNVPEEKKVESVSGTDNNATHEEVKQPIIPEGGTRLSLLEEMMEKDLKRHAGDTGAEETPKDNVEGGGPGVDEMTQEGDTGLVPKVAGDM